MRRRKNPAIKFPARIYKLITDVAIRLIAGERQFTEQISAGKYGSKHITFSVSDNGGNKLGSCNPKLDSAKVSIYLGHPHYKKFKGLALRKEVEVTLVHELAHAFTPNLTNERTKERVSEDNHYWRQSSPAEVIAYSTDQIFRFKLLLDYAAEELGAEAVPEMRRRILHTISTIKPSASFPTSLWSEKFPKEFKKHSRDIYKFVTHYDPLDPKREHYPEFAKPAKPEKKVPAKRTSWRKKMEGAWADFRTYIGWRRH